MVSGQFGAGVPQPCGTPRTSNDAHGWHPAPHPTEPLEFRQSHKPATAPYIRFCGTPEEKHPKSAGIPHHVTPHLQHRTTPHHADTYSCPHLHSSTFLEDGAHMHVPHLHIKRLTHKWGRMPLCIGMNQSLPSGSPPIVRADWQGLNTHNHMSTPCQAWTSQYEQNLFAHVTARIPWR